MSAEYDYAFKYIIIGDSGVGKSCLLLRYADRTYTSNFSATIGVDFKIKHYEYKEGKVKKEAKLQLWDSAGQDRFRTITLSYYHGANAILLVYDITSAESFNNLSTRWIPDIKAYATEDVPVLLVGNKIDMKQKREVDYETGKALADKHGWSFIETSASDNKNVDEAFESMAAHLCRLKLQSDGLIPQVDRKVVVKGIEIGKDDKDSSGRCFC